MLEYAEFRDSVFYVLFMILLETQMRFFQGRMLIGRMFVWAGSDADCPRSRELNRMPGRPRQGRGGPDRGHLDPKIGQPKHKTIHVILVWWSSLHL